EASMSTTSDPESDEVTKNNTTRMIATPTSTFPPGNPSSSSNSELSTLTEMLLPSASSNGWPSWPRAINVPGAFRSSFSAVPPNTVNHTNASVAGTNSTAATNWRTVRPLEIRAMNTPTKGAQEIHQPQ